MQPLKILIIHSFYQLRGGEDAAVEQEIELLKQNYSVEIMRFHNQFGWKGALQFLCSIWNVSTAIKVRKKIKEFEPDVVHIHNWHFALGPLVFREINRLKIPVVHTIHNFRLLCPSGFLLHNGKLFTNSLRQSFAWDAVRNKVYRSSARQTFWLAFVVWFHKKIGTWKKINLYVCLSSFTVDLFQESNFGVSKEQYTVKPNFTPEPATPQRTEREQHFLYIGRLSEEKGIESLLKAFSELPFSLKIAGDGPLKGLVLKAVKEFATISYIGNLTTTEVATELQKTQALVFSSIWYEGMPMTILESLSTNTPVLASNIGAMTFMITNGYDGLHFEPGNVDDLKAVVSRFDALSISKKQQMGTNAFDNYKSRYSPALQLDYFETIYNKLLRKKDD